ADAVVRLRDRIAAKRPGVPLRAGILLATNRATIAHFCAQGGVSVPKGLRDALIRDRDAGGREHTLEFLSGVIRTLHDAGIPPHLFTLNDAAAAETVLGRTKPPT
ncbi:MAG: methylenetetrahydrofolate reductase, partial [Gammaproteobacteria bacterium]